uniref:Uncharacterized protein LOC111103402 isoform X3 n=1 Tax=Crassostrea virginica TaxID=6565 RepID=A0A8B8AMF9_CRAVI|nr:uncharacterized protein LOC111103402 isoform X3 [Crassostrea virginica]
MNNIENSICELGYYLYKFKINMPPRKRKARVAPKPAKKRVNSTTRATSRTPLPEAMDSSAPSQLLDNNNAVIDYDQLAAAIIRQQQQAATFSSPVEANPAPAASGSNLHQYITTIFLGKPRNLPHGWTHSQQQYQIIYSLSKSVKPAASQGICVYFYQAAVPTELYLVT